MKLGIEVCWRCYRKDRSECKETPEEPNKCSRFVYNPKPVPNKVIKRKPNCMSCTISRINFNHREELICTSRDSGLYGKSVRRTSSCDKIRL